MLFLILFLNNININSLKLQFLLLFLYKTYINTPKMQFFLLFWYKTYINTPKMLFFFVLKLYKLSMGVSICLDVVSIETLDLDTEKKSVSMVEKISTVSKS